MTIRRESYVDGLPIFKTFVEGATNRFGIEEEELENALRELDEKVAERIDEIEDDYLQEHAEASEDSSLIAQEPDRVAFYLPVRELEELTATLGGSTAEIRDAVRRVHQEVAKRVGADDERVENTGALVIWSPKVYRYVAAGLSIQQARVRAYKDEGVSPDGIADELGMEVGTVKSHLYRASEKIEKCEQLVGLGTGAKAELRLLIGEEDEITLQRRVEEDSSPEIEKRIEELDEAITEALDDLQIGGGGVPESGRMDHERTYVDEIPQL